MSGAVRRKLKNKKPPEGWELIEEVIEDFELQMKEAVADEHDGKRKAEMGWKIHRLHWEKNRFIFDLMYQRKVMSRELVGGRGGGRSPGRAEALGMNMTHGQRLALHEHAHAHVEGEAPWARATLSTPLFPPLSSQFDYLSREKIADAPLIAKWRKPGWACTTPQETPV